MIHLYINNIYLYLNSVTHVCMSVLRNHNNNNNNNNNNNKGQSNPSQMSVPFCHSDRKRSIYSNRTISTFGLIKKWHLLTPPLYN